MGEVESFMVYSARDQALQAVVVHKVSDLALAEHLIAGMPGALYLKIVDTYTCERRTSTIALLNN